MPTMMLGLVKALNTHDRYGLCHVSMWLLIPREQQKIKTRHTASAYQKDGDNASEPIDVNRSSRLGVASIVGKAVIKREPCPGRGFKRKPEA